LPLACAGLRGAGSTRKHSKNFFTATILRIKSELSLKIVPLNVTVFGDAGTAGLLNGLFLPEAS